VKKIALIFLVLSVFLMVGCKQTLKTGQNQAQEQNQAQTQDQNQEEEKQETIFGVYEVCSDLENCNVEKNIKKIKQAGFEAVIVTATDEDENKSFAYYSSEYLPMPDYVEKDYFKRVVESAHENNIKVYASVNLPHNYWLKNHPDWIIVWSNNKKGDYYEQDYFHRSVPASRITSELECKKLLENLIKEIEALGVDGIDINDNFQFPDQYVEQTDQVLFSSYDQFTLNKFNSQKELDWFEWRSKQVTQLIKFFSQTISIDFRPHLLTHANPYEYYGLDYKEIGKYADKMYFMIMPDQTEEKYNIISEYKNAAVSTYLFEQMANKQEVLKILDLIKQKGANEIYLYNFDLIEKRNLWDILQSI